MSDEPADETEPAEPANPEKKVKPPKPPKTPKTPKEKGKQKGFNWLLVLIPVAVVAALALAVALPPTHAMLANGPLKPLFARFSPTSDGAVAARAAKSSDPVADVKRLNESLETDRKSAAAKDAQIAQLQSQVNQLQAPPKSTTAPVPIAKATAPAVSDEVKRAATYWAAMDADKAAAIVKQLPDAYVKLVFSQMPPDAVSDVMSELPAKTAARLTASVGSDAP